MHTRVHSSHPARLDRPAAPPASFARWAGRASLLLLTGGLVSLNLLAGAPGELTVATAWGYIGASLATMLGAVTGVAAATAGMNAH